ncbi:VanW family protein [Tepidimicrobium xylanilyticum]|uniref:Vancomycin resistance protein YoaR, contains peptidoglycan-binding and VanW domains n=1 Tax=Tepidimicrobium xylanilyticum TaxID=1123352 RepID=A0A1H2ZXM0_9FIRM|nr:VanW family protein [Tepidimicrobium xylanilyticum]SDX22302.1 Vancomycin resistance protein YoaR, contains peptidoglycan-binding and VanW domains [Tepidimicrobium xylanilyticum]
MERSNRKIKIAFMFLSIVIASIIGLGFYGYFKILNTNLIYQGVRVEKYDLSLMTKEEGLNYIKENHEKELKDRSMKLIYADKEYVYSLDELGLYSDYEKAINEAYSVGREGSIFKRIKDIIYVKKNGIVIPLDSNIDKNRINHIVDTISEEIDSDAKDAEFHFNNGNISITNEVVGRVVDKEKLSKAINDNIDRLDTIEIPVENILPKVTKSLLSRINGVIGEYSTSFKGSSQNRIENIRISATALKGKLLMPGESLSFNDTTGPRDKKFGYKEANVILNGEFTPDVGGGVCQTSTTLYNALLLADVTILERSPHSIPATYVKFGQDAAVAYGFLDLKFRNDFDFPIYIDSKMVGNQLYFYIYGDKRSKDYTVKIESEIIETIPANEELILDETLEPGSRILVQAGRKGYKVNTYKSIIKNGKTVSRELISKDFYRPKNFIYKVGKDVVETSNNLEDELNNRIDDIEMDGSNGQ